MKPNVVFSQLHFLLLFGALLFPSYTKAQTNVVGWGQNTYGQNNIPLSASNVISVIGGNAHILGLRSDGTVVAWGTASYGQTNLPPRNDVSMIAAGSIHTVLLMRDGSVAVAGQFFSGDVWVPKEATNIVSIAQGAGAQHALALRADGQLIGWGAAFVGTPPPISNVVSIAVGANHALALRADGSLVTWGAPGGRALRIPGSATNIVAIAAGFYHNVALRADGRMLVWGESEISQTGVVTIASSGLSAIGLRANGLISVIEGTFQGMRLSSAPPLSNVVAVGGSSYGGMAVIGQGPPAQTHPLLKRVVAAGRPACFRMEAVGELPLSFQWYRDGLVIPGATNASFIQPNAQTNHVGEYTVTVSNRLGGFAAVASLEVLPIEIAVAPTSQSAYPGQSVTLTVRAFAASRLSYQWFRNGVEIPGGTNTNLLLPAANYSDAGTYRVVISDGLSSTEAAAELVVAPVAIWPLPNLQMTVPAELSNVVAVTTSGSAAIGLQSNGTLVMWGQIRTNAIPPSDLTNIIAIDSGSLHYVALRNNGTVTTWGSPVAELLDMPPNLSNVVAISANEYQTIALRSDGTLAQWGRGPNLPAGYLTLPEGLSNIVAIAAGYDHSLALRDDGTVTAWGKNRGGQTNVPPGLTNVVGIAAGDEQSYLLLADGGIVAWGYGANGSISIPASATNGVAIAAGNYFGLLLRADGTLVRWGEGANPDFTPGLTNVAAIAAAANRASVVLGDGPPTVADTMRIVGWNGSAFSVSVAAQSGRVFRLEYKDDLNAPAWTPLPLVAGRAGRITLTDPNGGTGQRIYRVRRW